MARASWWTRAAAFLKGRPQADAPAAEGEPPALRLVIDTNIFVAAVRAPGSSSRRLLEAAAAGRVKLLVSPPVFTEYRRVLPRAVQSDDWERLIRSWIALAEPVDADRGERIVTDDPDDDKFIALALSGKADAIVSNDDHLLSLGEIVAVRVVRPGEAVRWLEAGSPGGRA